MRESGPNGLDPRLIFGLGLLLGPNKAQGPKEGICVILSFDLTQIILQHLCLGFLFHFSIFFLSPLSLSIYISFGQKRVLHLGLDLGE